MSQQKAVFHISGLHCVSCVQRLEEKLIKTIGVNNTSVSLLDEKATISFDPQCTDIPLLVHVVEETGFSVRQIETLFPNQLKKQIISLGGITCAGCVRKIESVLGKTPGVNNVTVNLATEQAEIVYDPRVLTTMDTVRKTITNGGYEYRGVINSISSDSVIIARQEEISDLKKRVFTGIFLSVIIFIGSMQNAFPWLHNIPRQTMLYLLFILTTPVVFWVGQHFLVGAYKSIR
jgi:Cu+-exporting ATPase